MVVVATRCASLFVSLALLSSALGCGGAPVCGGDACEDADTMDVEDGGAPSDAVDDVAARARCADLFATGACPPHRLCDEVSQPPVCLSGCEAGYLLRDDGTCVSCDEPGVECGPPTCEPDVEGSISDDCAAAHRVCDASSPGAAVCGACRPRFVEDVETGACVAECGLLVCDEGAYPEVQGGVCVCEERPCGPGAAQSLGTPPICSSCTPEFVCDPDDGELAIHPRLDASGRCVCKTASGFYWSSDQAARRCDADGDGWITTSAWRQLTSSDPTVRAIAEQGCVGVRFVDRIELRNEYGQSRVLHLCRSSTSEAPCGAADPAIALPLVEPDVNDRDADAPFYVDSDGVGRRLRARELNALTKGCASATGDYDADDVYDVDQAQAGTIPSDLIERWAEFAYFMEIHVGTYSPPGAGEAAGRYEIAERSRCTAGSMDEGGAPVDDRFPLAYTAGTPSYWMSCARQRDVAFTPNASASGFDFAHYGYACDEGACEVPPAPRPPEFDGRGGQPAPHGLCDAALPFPENGVPWMGMQHYSQFKCVRVGPALPVGQFYDPNTNPSGAYDFQSCGATPASDDAHLDVACRSRLPIAGEVGWAAVRYTGSTRHARGCVDERELDGVCGDENLPPSPPSLLGFSQSADDFGRILTCPKFCGHYATPEVCTAGVSLDDDCDGSADNIILDDAPNLGHACHTAPTISVRYGEPVYVFTGTVDANGPDFVRVSFPTTHVTHAGAGAGFRTRIELVAGSDATHLIDTSCGGGNCGGGGTVIERHAPYNPNNCLGNGNCRDNESTTTSWVVRVRRRPAATAICVNGEVSRYTLHITNGR